MALTLSEVVPGCVAYFDASMLNGDARIIPLASPPNDKRPFVCVAVAGNRSTWAELTRQHRDDRLLIKSEWRLRGTKAWQESVTYLNDGKSTYSGENQAFVDASQSADTYPAAKRQYVHEDGVSAIVAIILKRGGTVVT